MEMTADEREQARQNDEGRDREEPILLAGQSEHRLLLLFATPCAARCRLAGRRATSVRLSILGLTLRQRHAASRREHGAPARTGGSQSRSRWVVSRHTQRLTGQAVQRGVRRDT